MGLQHQVADLSVSHQRESSQAELNPMGTRDCPAAVSGSDRRRARCARETGPGSYAAGRRSSWGQSHSSTGVPVVVGPVAYRCWRSWPLWLAGNTSGTLQAAAVQGPGSRPLREEAPHE